MNGDGEPGIAGIDDDGDGQVDEGFFSSDDDEDGAINEDWLDAHAFYLQDGNLVERQPVPWDESGVGGVSGRDFIVSVIAENVTRFRVERPLPSPGGSQLVYLALELTGASGGDDHGVPRRRHRLPVEPVVGDRRAHGGI